MNDGRYAQNKKDIRDIGADNVSDSDPHRAFTDGSQAGDQLRNRCAEANQRQPDHEFGNVELSRNAHGSANQPFTPYEQENEAAQNHQICHENPRGKE